LIAGRTRGAAATSFGAALGAVLAGGLIAGWTGTVATTSFGASPGAEFAGGLLIAGWIGAEAATSFGAVAGAKSGAAVGSGLGGLLAVATEVSGGSSFV